MAGPPFSSIDPPTPYAQWVQTKPLFADGAKNTRTKIYNHPTLTDMRLAFGVTNLVEFWFFIVMTPANEIEFQQIHTTWREKPVNSVNNHEYTGYNKKPPSCGTPNTLPCPPDQELDGAINNLAELVAGAGSTPDQVKAVKTKVIEMLMLTLKGATALVKK